MNLDLFLHLSINMSFIALAAYLVGRSKFIIRCAENPSKLPHWLILSLIFSLLSAVGTYSGVPVKGTLANTRLVGIIMSGFMGGPIVGFITGVISACYRYSVGGFTAEICAVATVLGGIFAGLVRKKVGFHCLTWKTGAAVALISEIVQKGMVLTLAKPFEAAWAAERIIALPTTIVSILGAVIFMVIIENIRQEQALYAARAAELSLKIASRTLPYTRQGLNSESAAKTAQIIYELTETDAVAITDQEKVLAYIGLGDDHYKVGSPIGIQATLQALSTGKTVVQNALVVENDSAVKDRLKSGIVAPLSSHGKSIGAVKMFRTGENEISTVDIQIADGLANLLSVQFELAELDQQRNMREKAELRALQAQINPHFLFNTINIIMSFCRTDPATARSLLNHLAVLMQRRFAEQSDFITLANELEEINSYLEIVKRRFGSRLTVEIHLEKAALAVLVPTLSIQPLVENAIQHGLFPKVDQCVLAINISRKEKDVVICISDNGIGITADKMQQILAFSSDGIGLKNVNSRLKSIYGESYGLQIDSKAGEGTRVIVRIPCNEVVSRAV
ncbi:MAG: LytS/YhcK type 5TM receptor domain-containing protein [Veillonellales bacterium]